MQTDNDTICLDMLKETDKDRYLATLLAPQEAQPDLVALYAFNAELARVRDLVREPLPGEVRLQYWRDLLEGKDHGETVANPVASALVAAIRRHNLPRAPLVAMVDARTFDLYDDPMEDRAMFEGYAGETASALIQLASLVLDPAAAAGSASVAGHAGVAQAVAGAVLLMPQHRARGQVFVPLEILRAIGLDRESFLAGEDRNRISAAVEAFCGLGLDHLAKARASGLIAKPLVPSYLTATLAGPVLAAARRLGAGVFDRDIRPAQWRRQWQMLRLGLTRRL
ncbi:phytoene/squalene synthase family protein [Rhizobium sp. RU36D]|uniref:phytoene/squalene synthase family protein n=1 Tax=Rhizobium sp. RU36D TaxID=1907415 RepID=UPI0009D8EF70|nr:phytoene/squalene synthase family protein [Rhizobium sp. RU36D]SMC64777.1 phytoene synthase [Rhizobium sp. RU36D]